MVIDRRQEQWQRDKPGQCAKPSFKLTAVNFFLGIMVHANLREGFGAASQTVTGERFVSREDVRGRMLIPHLFVRTYVGATDNLTKPKPPQK